MANNFWNQGQDYLDQARTVTRSLEERSPFEEWMRDPQFTESIRQDYTNLRGRYQDISERGILSPEEMSKMMFQFREQQAPGLAQQRGRLYSDIQRRFGPGRAGGAAKSVANVVDVPAMHAESQFASDLYRTNIASRQQGLQGQQGLFGTLFAGQQNYAEMVQRLKIAQMQADLQRELGETEFIDYLSAFTPEKVSLT